VSLRLSASSFRSRTCLVASSSSPSSLRSLSVSSFTAASAACASFLLDSSLCLHTHTHMTYQSATCHCFIGWLPQQPVLALSLSLAFVYTKSRINQPDVVIEALYSPLCCLPVLPSSLSLTFVCTHIPYQSTTRGDHTIIHFIGLPPLQPVLPSSLPPAFLCRHMTYQSAIRGDHSNTHTALHCVLSCLDLFLPYFSLAYMHKPHWLAAVALAACALCLLASSLHLDAPHVPCRVCVAEVC